MGNRGTGKRPIWHLFGIPGPARARTRGGRYLAFAATFATFAPPKVAAVAAGFSRFLP
jgi:hypothetical protein